MTDKNAAWKLRNVFFGRERLLDTQALKVFFLDKCGCAWPDGNGSGPDDLGSGGELSHPSVTGGRVR